MRLLTEDILVCLPKSVVAHPLLLSKIGQGEQARDQASLAELYEEKKKELGYIKDVSFDSYSGFGRWVVEVIGKAHETEFTILMDKFSPENMVCILASTQPEQIKRELVSINLPTEFTI